jgi:hypothetical protein
VEVATPLSHTGDNSALGGTLKTPCKLLENVGNFSSSKRKFVNTTQEATENGDWVGTLDLDTVGENTGDWPLSSDWNFDDNPDVGEVHGIEVTAQVEVLGNKIVTLSPRRQSEESRIGYFMALFAKRY